MAIKDAKIYFDGSHYIAIPPTEHNNVKKRDKTYTSEDEEKKKAFDEAYKNTPNKNKKEKAEKITMEIAKHFKNEEEARAYTQINIDRLNRNLIERKKRLARKINLGVWNYFCTFTYDDEKHTEESFKKKLSDCFKKMCYRNGWVYIGVWERSPKNNRLHFHGVFNIPDSGMVGELTELNDFNIAKKSRKKTLQNSYFEKRFGRNDFSPINSKSPKGTAAAYLMKYIGKTDERVVYSKGTYAYFVSDILNDDIACTYGQEDKKFVLFDNFSCFTDGCYIGQVSPEVIAQMPKSN